MIGENFSHVIHKIEDEEKADKKGREHFFDVKRNICVREYNKVIAEINLSYESLQAIQDDISDMESALKALHLLKSRNMKKLKKLEGDLKAAENSILQMNVGLQHLNRTPQLEFGLYSKLMHSS